MVEPSLKTKNNGRFRKIPGSDHEWYAYNTTLPIKTTRFFLLGGGMVYTHTIISRDKITAFCGCLQCRTLY